MVSYNKWGVRKEGWQPVLILIVMDNGLLPAVRQPEILPCSPVLILIVMDNGLLLGEAADRLNKLVGVLILIVMDNGLLQEGRGRIHP